MAGAGVLLWVRSSAWIAGVRRPCGHWTQAEVGQELEVQVEAKPWGQGCRSGTRTSLGDKDVSWEGEAGEGGRDGCQRQGEVTEAWSLAGKGRRSPAGQARSRLAAAGPGQGELCQRLFFHLSARSCTSPLLCPTWFVTLRLHSYAKSAFLDNAHTSCQLLAGLPC